MGNLTTIARPYAKAILDLARDSNNYEQWSAMLNFLSIALGNSQVNLLLTNNASSALEKTQLLFDLDPGILNNQAKNLIKLLAYNKRLIIIPELYKMYEKMRKDLENQVVLNLIVANDIDVIDMKKLESLICKNFPDNLIINHEVDSSLIGGGKIKVGDRVFDLSVKGKLKGLYKHLRQ